MVRALPRRAHPLQRGALEHSAFLHLTEHEHARLVLLDRTPKQAIAFMSFVPEQSPPCLACDTERSPKPSPGDSPGTRLPEETNLGEFYDEPLVRGGKSRRLSIWDGPGGEAARVDENCAVPACHNRVERRFGSTVNAERGSPLPTRFNPCLRPNAQEPN